MNIPFSVFKTVLHTAIEEEQQDWIGRR